MSITGNVQALSAAYSIPVTGKTVAITQVTSNGTTAVQGSAVSGVGVLVAVWYDTTDATAGGNAVKLNIDVDGTNKLNYIQVGKPYLTAETTNALIPLNIAFNTSIDVKWKMGAAGTATILYSLVIYV